MKRVVIDCEKLSERRQAHKHLAEMLNFPEYYGKNLDALFDCLTELGECTIVLDGAEKLRESGGYGARVIKVMDAAARSNPMLTLEAAAQSDEMIGTETASETEETDRQTGQTEDDTENSADECREA